MLTQTDAPSRSKQAGPCWIGIDGTYATPAGRQLACHIGQTLTGKATLRRASRTTTDRDSWTVVVTGNPDDEVTVSLGSPQPVTATITGVTHS